MGKSNTEMLKIAQKYLGYGGSIFRKYCGLPSGSAWCNAFVCYIFNEAGNASLYYGGKKVTYCPTSIKWCQSNLAQIPIYLALPCDVIYFDWEPNGIPNHIGFVRERKSDQAVYTIEGNTSGGIVAQKTRPVKYVCGCYRPHFKPTGFDANKKLDVDGYFGYNSIAVMQKWLGVTIDGILGQGTVKALQKRLKVTQDGSWGTKTSKALQKLIRTTVDGDFGAKSVKALQTYLNKHVFPSSVSKQDKMVAWAQSIAKSGKYKYKKWTSDAKTHQCPICTPKSGNGWNCIGFSFASWRHGAGLASKCNCGVISNEVWEKILKAKTDAEALKIAREKIGIQDIKVIRNGGKAIPLRSLQKGDICALFKSKTYYHTVLYEGDSKYAESNSGSKPNIRADVTLSSAAKANLKVAIRYTGK